MDSDEEFVYTDDDIEGETDEEVENAAPRKSTPSLNVPIPEETPYSVLSRPELSNRQKALIRNVGELTQLSADDATVMLLHYQWSKEKLIDAFFSDSQKARLDSGALQNIKHAEMNKNSNPEREVLCPIMFEEFPVNLTFSMGCVSEKFADSEDHRFSISSWREYLRSSAKSGASCIYTTCPRETCSCVVPPSVWEDLLSVPQEGGDEEEEEEEGVKKAKQYEEALRRYERFLLNSFVDINILIKWCPTPGCENAVEAHGSVDEVCCSNCRTRFCFKCNMEAHIPIDCLLLSIWLEKCRNESETANWIMANTKSCPKCRVRIEKNQGCNHMKCGTCQFDFCWVCMKEWSSHKDYYNCNKFDPKSKNDGQAKAKRELDRYLHYFQRYDAHDKSGKFAKRQLREAEAKMIEIQSGAGAGWVEVQFLGEAVTQLIENRRMLKYTYALAYYLPDGAAKTLFEHNQSDLERYTEKLSELTEMPWDKIDRTEVNNQRIITDKFMRKINEAVQTEGLVELATDNMRAQNKSENLERESSKVADSSANRRRRSSRK